MYFALFEFYTLLLRATFLCALEWRHSKRTASSICKCGRGLKFSALSRVLKVLRLRCTIRLNFLLVTLLLYISGTITDISLKQVPFQHYNTKWNSWNRKVKCPRVFGPRHWLTAQALLRQITERQTGAQPSKILWHYYAVFARSWWRDIRWSVYIFSYVHKNLPDHPRRACSRHASFRAQISFHAALQNTPGYPHNKSKHVRKNLPS